MKKGSRIISCEYDGKKLKLWTPATYRIEVEGAVDETWADSLAGMRISSRQRADNDKSTVTILTGLLRDQAELSGVLNGLYELHLPILSVNILAEDNGESQDPGKPSPLSPEVENTRKG